MLISLSSLCLYRPLRTALFFSTYHLLSTPLSSNTSVHIWSYSTSHSTQVSIAPGSLLPMSKPHLVPFYFNL